MTEEKVEFVQFGTRQRDSHTYALDANGVMWVNVEADMWESIEPEPRYLKQGLTPGQLLQVMQGRGTKVV